MMNYKGLVIILLLLLSLCLQYDSVFGALKCIPKEREALLTFKQGLIDDYDILSSWGSEDAKKECCQWWGVKCSNETRHVISLHLSHIILYNARLRGKISSALLELNYLNDLDLSGNNFGYDEIPDFIGSLKNLQHLNLMKSNFSSVVPYQLGNLTSLKTLSLGGNELAFTNLDWLSNLSSLSLLDLSGSYLRGTNLLQDILKLPSLTELDLSLCRLPTYFFVNSPSTSLSILDLSFNWLTSSAYHWLFNISTSFRSIDLSYNHLLGTIPDAFGTFTFLEHLDLSYNLLTGGIPKSLGNLSHLQTLDLSCNSLSEPLPELFYKLSVGAKDSLEILQLDGNKIYGSLPDFTQFSSLRILQLQDNELNGSFPNSFGEFSRLEYLDLSGNQITGLLPDLRALVSLKELRLSSNKLASLPASLGQLSMLEFLDVSSNSLQGTISDAHLSKLQNLKHLDLSFNSLVLNFTADWIPPFQLHVIRLASCNMGTRFPLWLQTQTNFSDLDLSYDGILDEVPKWFWDLSQKLSYLNLSHNQISGRIPTLPSNLVNYPIIDISFNNFSGHLPLFSPNSLILQLSNNEFLGSISSICTNAPLIWLWILDLSNNQFYGELPNCWENMTGLYVLNLSNNKLSGNIPYSLGSLNTLFSLHLRDNNFSGELPSTLKNCQNLRMIDVGGNKLSGNIPTWIGTHLKRLIVLSLRHNNFNGSIPPEICYLTEIQILDLFGNSLSERIPPCFNNFTYLVQKNKTTESTINTIGFRVHRDFFLWYIDYALVQWKGQKFEYGKTLGLLRLIDLSSNRLVGNIPHEFSKMRALISLNLSRNYLSGGIISNIGQMEMLECLDLSINQFSGEIPIGLMELHYLAVLNLSNNNLSGKIPTSTQLQSFNASTYAGNRELCGLPLTRCPGDGTNPPIADNAKLENVDEENDGFVTHEFYISVVLGFIVGFWGIIGTLVVKNSWRYAYFNSFNKIRDWLYITTNIYATRLKGSLRAN